MSSMRRHEPLFGGTPAKPVRGTESLRTAQPMRRSEPVRGVKSM